MPKKKLKMSDAGLVRKYQCTKMFENFSTVVNFIIYKKLKSSKHFEEKKSKTSKL